MFWIPIGVVVLLIMGCVSAYQEYAPSSDKNQWEKRRQIKKDFSDMVLDDNLYHQVMKKYGEKYYASSYKAICNFTGSEPNPDKKYPLINEWRTWAVTSDMCQKGKLPAAMIIGNLNVFTTEHTEREFIERFLLKVENQIREHGVNTYLVYSDGAKEYKLSDYVLGGYGRTKCNGDICWAQGSVNSIRYNDLN